MTAAGALCLRPRPGHAEGGATPALLGGTPVRKQAFPSWPMVLESDLKPWLETLRARAWCRIGKGGAARFEAAYAELLGAPLCLATMNGTNALFTALNALKIGPGDEVIVPPYTFAATVNVVLLQHALPIFVDSDRETFQIDAGKIPDALTSNTRCLLPVHLGGIPADMDAIMAIAKKRSLPVVEDACQAHLAEWRGRRVGSVGTIGCFSFQESKNLSSGEGGALVTADSELFELCYSFHTNGRAWKRRSTFGYPHQGTNARMTEFQATLLLRGLTRLEAQAGTREQNADYLTQLLSEVRGIRPARMYPGATRNAYHLYMFRYEPGAFRGLSRAQFLRALQAEGVPCSGGYSPLNKEPFLEETLNSRAYRRIYTAKRLKEWFERNRCPENDRLCREAVWLFQSMFLGTRKDMEDIAEAVAKIQKHADPLAKKA